MLMHLLLTTLLLSIFSSPSIDGTLYISGALCNNTHVLRAYHAVRNLTEVLRHPHQVLTLLLNLERLQEEFQIVLFL
jgi:hypothetical protein